MKYRPGKTARKMYRHKAKYGVAGMTKRQLRALAREMDIGVNPRGSKHTHKDHEKLARRSIRWQKALERAWGKESDMRKLSPGRQAMLRRWGQLKDRASRDSGTVYSRLIMQKTPWGNAVRKGDGGSFRSWAKRPLSKKAKRILAGHRNPTGHAPDFTRQFRDGGRIEIWRDGEVVLYDSLDRDMDDFFIKPYEVARLIADVKDSRLAAWHHYTKDMIRDDYELQGRGGKRSNPQRRNPGYYGSQRNTRSRWKTRRRNPGRQRNPKRDGTPTRGENRRVKYTAHLEALVQRGRDLETKLKLIKKAPIGSSTPHYYEEQAPLKAEIRAAAVAEGYTGRAAAVSQSMRAAAAAKTAPVAVIREERAEISSAMRELNEALLYLQLQLKDIDPEAPEDEREQIMDQIAGIAKQKKKLREVAPEVATATNPPRRRRYRLTGLRQYTQACRAYCRTAKRCCSNPCSRPRRH